jgi:hypothetical protein
MDGISIHQFPTLQQYGTHVIRIFIYIMKNTFLLGYDFLSLPYIFHFTCSSAIMNSLHIIFFGNILMKVLFLQFVKYLMVRGITVSLM